MDLHNAGVYNLVIYVAGFNELSYGNSVYLFPHTSTPDFFEQTPYTGFEPASLLQPTVFKTAPSPPGHTANIAVWWNCYIRNCFCHHFVQFRADFLPLTAMFVHCRKLAQCVGFEPTRRINARRLSKPFQYHYGNTAS